VPHQILMKFTNLQFFFDIPKDRILFYSTQTLSCIFSHISILWILKIIIILIIPWYDYILLGTLSNAKLNWSVIVIAIIITNYGAVWKVFDRLGCGLLGFSVPNIISDIKGSQMFMNQTQLSNFP
jgi:hypothetical protein